MGIAAFIIFAVVINSLLALGIFLRNQEALSNRLYALQVLFLNLWIVVNFLENEPELVGRGAIEWFLRFDFVFALFFFYTWFRFCAEFVEHKISDPRFTWLNRSLLAAAILLSALSLYTPYILTDVVFYNNVIHFADGSLWFLYLLYLLLTAIGGLAMLVFAKRWFRRHDLMFKYSQVNVILFGFILSIGFATFINLFLQTFFPISLAVSRLGILGMTFLVASMAYAVVKTRFLDVRFFVARTVAFSLIITITAVVYAVLLSYVGTKLVGLRIETNVLIFGIVFAVVASLSFPWLYRIVTRLTDAVLYKHRYKSSELLRQLSKIMAETIELEQMNGLLKKTLIEEMRVVTAIFLQPDDKRFEPLKRLFPRRSWSNWQPFLFDQLKDGKQKELLKSHDIHVLLPLIVKKEFVGMIALGSKASGEMYFQGDIDLLEIFAHEAAVAVKNAQSYLQIQQFNEELEGVVKKRTHQLRASHKRELKKAQEVSKLKDEFVFLAAHELKAPVFAIKGFLELVEPEKKKFSRSSREYLGNIYQASEHLNKLVNDLLQVAREDAGATKILVKSVDILPVVEEIIREQSVLAKKKKITIVLDAREHSHVMADLDKFREVVANLVSNAIKYNRDGGTIKVSFKKKGRALRVSVADTGFGIPKAQQKKIFGKFFRASGQATEGVLGTGLGLFITKMLVEKMDGKISFTSIEGKGTTFTLQLPIAKK